MTRLYSERDLPPDAWDGPDPLADMTRQRDEAQARVGVLLAALNVALNDDDPEALEGARMALQEIRAEDLTLLRQRDEAVKAFQRERARVGRVHAALDNAPAVRRWIGDTRLVDEADIRAALADRPTDD